MLLSKGSSAAGIHSLHKLLFELKRGNDMKKTLQFLPLLMSAVLLLSGCGAAPAATEENEFPDDAKMMEITTQLMPEVQKISQMQNGNLESNYDDIIGSLEYFDSQMGYARVTDPAYPNWETLTGYYKSILTENYMKNNYMGDYLLTAEEAKNAESPLMYQEFDGVLGRNTAADGAGIVEYATATATFSDVSESGFTAAMESMDGYGSKVASTVVFLKGQDGNWRVDSVDNQWSDDYPVG